MGKCSLLMTSNTCNEDQNYSKIGFLSRENEYPISAGEDDENNTLTLLVEYKVVQSFLKAVDVLLF